LKLGKIWHCGCQGNAGRDTFGDRTRTHGMYASPTYSVWRNMIRRCHTPTHHNYRFYGGRGITVCDKWRGSFTSFLSDMGEKPKGLELDRVDNEGPYSAENCRWVTRSQNCRNRRSCRIIEHNGVALPLTSWSEALGIRTQTIAGRLKRGWSVSDALTP
jgi:hypothetical protein